MSSRLCRWSLGKNSKMKNYCHHCRKHTNPLVASTKCESASDHRKNESKKYGRKLMALKGAPKELRWWRQPTDVEFVEHRKTPAKWTKTINVDQKRTRPRRRQSTKLQSIQKMKSLRIVLGVVFSMSTWQRWGNRNFRRLVLTVHQCYRLCRYDFDTG